MISALLISGEVTWSSHGGMDGTHSSRTEEGQAANGDSGGEAPPFSKSRGSVKKPLPAGWMS